MLVHILLAACVALGAWLLWLAWRRPNRRRLAARLLASVLAPAALWWCVQPPTRQVPARVVTAIVLTPGYSPDTLRQLLRQLGRGTAVWSYQLPAVPVGARPLSSLLALAERRPALRQLHLLGRGLPVADLPLLGSLAVRLHALAPAGVTAAYWPRQLTLGQPLTLEGTLAPASRPAWVRLRGSGAGPDSVRVPAGGSGAFRLRYRPRVAGQLLPELLVRPASGATFTEPIPVEVLPADQPPVLLLAAAPGFEFKFLKNSLAGAGRAVALRTPVSRGLVQTEVVNQPAQLLDHLTPALLARYPVAVADAAALAALPAAETQAVQAAVQAGRLGLVVLAGSEGLLAAVPRRAGFGVQRLPGNATTPQLLYWPDAPAGLRTALPAAIRPLPGLRPLVLAGAAGVSVAAARRLGAGTVVVSTVPETFRWVLQNQAPAYAAYWNRLLEAARPPTPAPATWQLADAWPRQQHPLTLQLAASQLPAATELLLAQPLAGGPPARLALAQDPRLPEWSTATYWPPVPGWHAVRGPGAGVQHFFVFDSAAWQGPEQAARVAALAARPAALSPAGQVRQPWPAGWFMALFVLAAGFLWLEEKL